MNSIPDRAKVVIIGGGIVGCSVAYYLTKLGWSDVVVLERRTVAGGTTWHAAGLVTQLRATRTMIDINRVGAQLYSTLHEETGIPTGFRASGSLTVTTTNDRMDELKRTLSLGRCYGIEIHEISAEDAGTMWPLMRTDDLKGGIYIPKDGHAIPASAALSVARGAEMGGGRIVENVQVTGVNRKDGAVTGVSTDRGDIECEVVVCAAGMWSRQLGLSAGVDIPLHGAEHMWLVTNKMGIPEDIASLRDPDEQIYFRRDAEEQGAILMGGFETTAKPWGGDAIPDEYHFGLLEPDWEHFKVFWDNAVHRVPAMGEAGINRFCVSAESFTSDNRYLMGESPRPEELLSRHRAELDRHRGRAGRGQGGGRVDRRWRTDDGPVGSGHSPLPPIPEYQDLPARPDGRNGGHAVRYALPASADGNGSGSPAVAIPRQARLHGGLLRRSQRMGNGQTGMRHPAWSRCTDTRSDGRTGFRTRRMSIAPSAKRWDCSTRPRSRSFSCREGMPSPSLSGYSQGRWPSIRAGSCTQGCSTRGAASSPT